jgi:hypothetical protein
MSPKTLREVSGLGSQPASLKDSALIMIDLQNTYREGVMRLTDAPSGAGARRGHSDFPHPA